MATAEGKGVNRSWEETEDGGSRAGGHGKEFGPHCGQWEGRLDGTVSFGDPQCPQQDQGVQ